MRLTRTHGLQRAELYFFMTRLPTGKILPWETRFCYIARGFTFSRGSWKLVSLDHSLWLLLILRVIRNSKWMGKDWSSFWPLSLRPRLKLCWVFSLVIHLTIAIHTPPKESVNKNFFILIVYMLTPFILVYTLFGNFFFSLSLRLFALSRPESTETVISFLLPIYCICIYMTSTEDNAIIGVGGANILSLYKKNLLNDKRIFILFIKMPKIERI